MNSGNVSVGGDLSEGDTGAGLLEMSGQALVQIGGTLRLFERGAVNVGSASSLIANRIDNTSGGEFNFLGVTLETAQFLGDLVNQGGTLTPSGNDLPPTFPL